ncbi:hypothetical protein G6F43_001093 [Rhizopus delemar]|nr:hypothetical protein G6F43_001093 [Rhizopus delemar]
MDSDLEDKIMSIVQYDSGVKRKRTNAESVPPTRSSSPVPANTTETTSKIVATPKPSVRRKVETIHAPLDIDKKRTEFSAANELHIESSDDEEEGEYISEQDEETDLNSSPSESEEDEEPQDEEKTQAVAPLVTRHISLDNKQYMDDEDTSEEEIELGKQIQELIDNQIQGRNKYKNISETDTRVPYCTVCHSPGHTFHSCRICKRCGSSEHIRRNCDWLDNCRRCKQTGHLAADCKNPTVQKNCDVCGGNYHTKEQCFRPFHHYFGVKPPAKSIFPYCYYCSNKGHFGDECPELSFRLGLMPSVFKMKNTGGNKFEKKTRDSYKEGKRNNSYLGKRAYPEDEDNSYPSKKKAEYNYKRRFVTASGSGNNNNNYKAPITFVHSHNSRNSEESSVYNRKENNKKAKKESKSGNNGKWPEKKGKKGRKGNVLDQFFQPEKRNITVIHNKPVTGNSNWKAINNNSLPQPSRSGTVHLSNKKNRKDQGQQQQQNQYQINFVRGTNKLPKPSKSGVIDLTR